jgi:hypothetical protein
MWSKLTGDEKQQENDKRVREMLFSVARGKCKKQTKDKVVSVLKSKEGVKQIAGLGMRTVFQNPVKSALGAVGLIAAGKTIRKCLG